MTPLPSPPPLLSLPPLPSPHPLLSPHPLPHRRLRVGCGEWGFRALPMADHFRIAEEFGFRELEFGIGGGQPGRLPEAPSAADIAAYRGLVASSGIATPGCCIENDFSAGGPEEVASAVVTAIRQSRAAAECGARQVRSFAGFTPWAAMDEARYARMVDALIACDRELERLGMSMAIETHGAIDHRPDGSALHIHTVTTHPAGLRRLLADLPARIGFNYDPGNLRAADPADPSCAVDLLRGRITYCHLKDWARDGEGWRAAAVGDVTDGIDWANLLPRTGYDGTFLIEYEPLHDTRDGIRRSLAALRAAGFELEY